MKLFTNNSERFLLIYWETALPLRIPGEQMSITKDLNLEREIKIYGWYKTTLGVRGWVGGV